MFALKIQFNPLRASTETEPPPQTNQQQQSNVSVRGNNRGRGGGRERGGRFSSRQSGETDPCDMSLAPLNIYENQVIRTGRST